MKTRPASDHGFDLHEFQLLRQAAIETVSNRFFEEYPDLLESFGERGYEATREDVGFTLDFLRPALEFGYLRPFVDYLIWLSEVLSTRGVPEKLIVNMLDWLKDFFETELPGDNGRYIASTLQSSREKLLSNKSYVTQIDKNMPRPWPEYVDFEQALLKGDLPAAKDMFQARIDAGKSILDVELHLVQPALYQVGRDWQQNTVTVAQEHLATATAMTLMAQEFTQATLGEPNGKTVICACVEGNNHAVGLRIVADAFEYNGWDVMFLGPDVPTKDLVHQVKVSRPDLLCLSVSMPDHLRVAKSAITELRRTLGEQVPGVMLGGLAINAFASIVDKLGADTTAPNAMRAVKLHE